jgi:acyl-CoA thioester hydrolase
MERINRKNVDMKSTIIDIPKKFIFETEISVRITDLNFAGHLGNDSFLSLIHEARARFLHSFGYTELSVEGVGTIVNNASIIYKSQAYFGDCLIVKLALEDPGHVSCNIKYLLLNKETGKEVARAQTGFAFLNYHSGQLQRMPEQFKKLFDED